MHILKINMVLRNWLLVVLLIPAFFLAACSQKQSNTESSAAQNTPSETAEVQETSNIKKVEIDPAYLSLFAKAKEDVAKALSVNPGNFRPGTHYTELASKPVVSSDGKIEIIEFFSYGCGACFNAEPAMHAYAEQVPADVVFKRIPASFNPLFETLARGYYAANALGVDDEAHLALFDAIHVKRQNVGTNKKLAAFYAAYGVDQDKFLKALNSFSVNSLIERDRKLAATYQVSGVPTVTVGGAYATSGPKAKSMETWVQILDTLAQSLRAK